MRTAQALQSAKLYAYAPPPHRQLRPSLYIEQARRAHTTANTHGDDNVFHAPAAYPRSGAWPTIRAPLIAHRGGDGDGPAIDVRERGQGLGNAQLVTAKSTCTANALIDVPQARISSIFRTMALRSVRHGIDRANAHLVGIKAPPPQCAIGNQAGRGPPALRLLSLPSARLARCAIGQLGRVTGGDELAFLHLLAVSVNRAQALQPPRQRESGGRGSALSLSPACVDDGCIWPGGLVPITPILEASATRISSSNLPAACAAAVRCCDCSAYSSCESRETL